MLKKGLWKKSQDEKRNDFSRSEQMDPKYGFVPCSPDRKNYL
jgi:hypothetical protein